MKESLRNIVIAGPCALEPEVPGLPEEEQQWAISAQEAKRRHLTAVRLSLVKPRTKDGWDGVGFDTGVPILRKVAETGVTPATEILDVNQAEAVANQVLSVHNEVVLWLGSRNQNHQFQRDMGSLIAGDPRIKLGIKNQPWPAKDHWAGIVSHVIKGGANLEQLFHIHRGFMIGADSNGYRNSPDWEMAEEVQRETGVPVVVDPSHIGGSLEKVIKILENPRAKEFSGWMVETHPTPETALTDAKQQMDWETFDIQVPMNEQRPLSIHETVLLQRSIT